MDKFHHDILYRKILTKARQEVLNRPLVCKKIREGNFYNRAGEKIDYDDWLMLGYFEEYFQLAKEEVNGFTIDTKWIGMDVESERGDGKPYIYMIQISENEELLVSMFHYDEDLAYKMHNKLVFMADQKMLEDYLGL